MTLDAFMLRVKVAENGCWLWQGTLAPNGYGRISTGRTKRESAHRVSWRLHGRPAISPGFDLCHSCDVRNCVNPYHLFVGTRSENMLDAVRKGRLVTPKLGGAACGRSKLTEKQVEAIRDARRRCLSYRQIAKQFGVVPDTVGRILRGETWKVRATPLVTEGDK
jgi:hypothetical protein